MAVRPVFLPSSRSPYRISWNAEFTYNSGFAVSQKQKNITAIHRVFQTAFPERNILEISSKSMQEGGSELSAFHLLKYVPSLGRSIPLENVFQAGKVFQKGGPFTDLLDVSPREAKRDPRLRESGPLTEFRFEGQVFPLRPATVFYDFLYINALLENENLAKIVLKYDAFTDIEFNPEKSLNCQAKSAALFVSLHRAGLLDKAADFQEFLGLFLRNTPVQPAMPSVPADNRPASAPEHPAVLQPGTKIQHKIWAEGTVTAVSGTTATISFPSVGEKKLGIDWILKNCTIL